MMTRKKTNLILTLITRNIYTTTPTFPSFPFFFFYTYILFFFILLLTCLAFFSLSLSLSLSLYTLHISLTKNTSHVHTSFFCFFLYITNDTILKNKSKSLFSYLGTFFFIVLPKRTLSHYLHIYTFPTFSVSFIKFLSHPRFHYYMLVQKKKTINLF
ncbi:hypothetical protein BDC45DRAFT_17639 [Circinella umbellata]|nr:hypothetical protein BDC45DRAFT_17639 [Circinella umbellata]